MTVFVNIFDARIFFHLNIRLSLCFLSLLPLSSLRILEHFLSVLCYIIIRMNLGHECLCKSNSTVCIWVRHSILRIGHIWKKSAQKNRFVIFAWVQQYSASHSIKRSMRPFTLLWFWRWIEFDCIRSTANEIARRGCQCKSHKRGHSFALCNSLCLVDFWPLPF